MELLIPCPGRKDEWEVSILRASSVGEDLEGQVDFFPFLFYPLC